MPNSSKDKCNYCGGTGHWEKDCKRKQHDLSQEEAQAEQKGKGKKRKGKEKKNEMTTSVSTVIMKTYDPHPGSTSDVPTPSASQTICFYIACDHKWMLDSGCTNHITPDISNFATYHALPTPQKAWFTDKKSHITYIGIRTVKGTTHIHGEPRAIELHDVLHSPRIGGHFFSILKVGRKGFQTTFTRHNAVITKENNTLLEVKVHGNHYWTTIVPPSTSVNLIGTKVSMRRYTHT